VADERTGTGWDDANEQAALWHAQLDSGTADLDAFEQWRAVDPSHAAAFARICAAAESLSDIGPVDLSGDPDVSPPRISRRQWLQGAAVMVVALAGGATWFALRSSAQASTLVGERKTLALADGLKIDLNTDTRVRWKLSPERNQVWLERGEVGITVLAGAVPCELHAAGQSVTIPSGDLNARLRDSVLDLSVLAGTCRVSQSAAAGSPRTLPIKAGESALLTGADQRIRATSEAERTFASGWREGVLVFDGQTLGVAVDEYNRYLTNKITIVDSDLAGIRLGGRFTSRDPKDFLDTLKSSFGIHAATGDNGAILLSR
jgi:transmembrane sensor